MLDIAWRAAGTVLHRPYVFVFFAAFLLTAVSRMGWRRTAVFSLIAWTVAFAAEFSSTRNGIPFGLYHYVDTTRAQELWISNVPFWDSLSFVFLTYVAYSLAIAVYSPLLCRRRDFQIADTREIRGSTRVMVTGALLMTLLDVIIDPLTVHGDRWFLGRVYFYPDGGLYFGVPLSNFLGWAIVGAATITLYQAFERRNPPPVHAAGIHHLAFAGLFDFGIYTGILLFNLALTFWIGETLLGVIGCFLVTPLMLLLASHPLNPRRHATPADVATHLRDFPASALAHLRDNRVARPARNA